MARAMSIVTAANAPADATYHHELSGRRYEAYREADKLRHRVCFDGNGDSSSDDVLVDIPIDYVIGAGTHFQIFVTEVDGFLVESPMTWYASKPGWAMSPGYDVPFPQAFERGVAEQCLFCHAGRAEAVEDSVHRIRFHELTMGCERCHGPGSLHIQRHSSGEALAGSDDDVQDFTIVNPEKLPRELAEDVCHQCHLTTKAYVLNRGRKLSDFRPGRRLHDFRVYYQLESINEPMRVVGHVEQQLLSRCYQESDSLSCLTCHSSHHTPEAEERLDYYRSICLECHQSAACKVDRDTLASTSPENDCVKCHMPRVATKTLHVAATHHRIGIHTNDQITHETENSGDHPATQLRPLDDLSHLSDLDRTRLLGLGYLKLALRQGPGSNFVWQRSQELLLRTREMGLREGNVDATLAHLFWGEDPARASRFAASALESPLLSAESRVNALFALASNRRQNKQYEEAIRFVDELTKIRRHSADWSLLGDCRLALGDTRGAVEAFETAVAINPNLVPIHETLCWLYQQQGNLARVERHRHIIERISAIDQRLRNEP
ncbi:MAG: hypothetical protein CMJ64_16625 [Planctomycetaceae bacterium]|nr:hypothetical protein [Planctomycetaceae bacterium]